MLDLMAQRLEDLDPPLREFSKYLRLKIKKRFEAEGPGWQQLDESTRKRLEGTSAGALTLKRGTLRASYSKKLQGYFKGQLKKGAVDSSAFRELRRLERKAENIQDPRAQQSRLSAGVKSAALERLEKKIERRAQAIEAGKAPRQGKTALQNHRILGRMYSMIRAQIKNGAMEVGILDNSALAVHNAGGPAGKGATEPERPFVFLEAEDLPVLAAMVEQHATTTRVYSKAGLRAALGTG